MNSIEGKIDGLVKRLDLQGEEINKLKAGEDEIRKDIKKQEETGKRIEQLEKAINELNRRFLEAKSEGIEELKRDLELQKKVIGELKMREERIRKDIQSLNQRFSGIPGGKTETPETTQLEKRIDSHESAIKKLQKSLEVLRIAVESSPSESVELSKFKIEMESRLRLLEKRMGKENG
jgi:chromosome segregation ATPase